MADDVEFGHVVDLTLGEPSGTELVADAAIGATTLTVDYAGDFEDAGEVVLNGEVLAYTAITYGDTEADPDVITLAAPLATAALTDDKVVRMAGGEPVADWLLHVSLGDGHPVDIPIPFEQRSLWSTVDVTTPVPVFVSADLESVVEVPGRTPQIGGAFIDPASTIPGGQAFSLDAPTATDGYPEDYGWWQVDATGKVLGFWRLVGGVWTAQTIVTQEALQVGNILVDALNGETITGVTITGSTVRTAASGPRWVMTSAAASDLTGYSGGASESTPGSLSTGVGAGEYYLLMKPPVYTGISDVPLVKLWTTATESHGQLSAGDVMVHAETGVLQLSSNDTMDIFAGEIGISGNVTYDSPAWTAYTPTFAAATTALTLGNFTRVGRWTQWGKTVHFVIVITANSSTGLGTGTYEFGLPTPPRNLDELVVNAIQTGPARNYTGRGSGTTPTILRLFLTSTFAAADVTSTGMTSGAVLRISGTYEAA